MNDIPPILNVSSSTHTPSYLTPHHCVTDTVTNNSTETVSALMSDCLTALRELPVFLDSILKFSITQIQNWAHRFIRLADLNIISEADIALVHRFCLRVKEIVTVWLAHHNSHSNKHFSIDFSKDMHSGNMITQELFMQIKQIVEQQPNQSKNTHVSAVNSIGLVIKIYVNKVLKIRKVHNNKLNKTNNSITNQSQLQCQKSTNVKQQVIEQSKQKSQVRIRDKSQDRRVQTNRNPKQFIVRLRKQYQSTHTPIILSSRPNNSIKPSSVSLPSLTSIYHILCDLDINSLQNNMNMNINININQSTCAFQQQKQLLLANKYKQCMNRNKAISMIIKEYQNGYIGYQKKIINKKNRDNNNNTNSVEKHNINDKNKNNSVNKVKEIKTIKVSSKIKQYIRKISQKNRLASSIGNRNQSIYEKQANSTNEQTQASSNNNNTGITMIKQQLMTHVNQFRKKYSIQVNKITIGQQSQSIPVHQTNLTMNFNHDNNKVGLIALMPTYGLRVQKQENIRIMNKMNKTMQKFNRNNGNTYHMANSQPNNNNSKQDLNNHNTNAEQDGSEKMRPSIKQKDFQMTQVDINNDTARVHYYTRKIRTHRNNYNSNSNIIQQQADSHRLQIYKTDRNTATGKQQQNNNSLTIKTLSSKNPESNGRLISSKNTTVVGFNTNNTSQA